MVVTFKKETLYGYTVCIRGRVPVGGRTHGSIHSISLSNSAWTADFVVEIPLVFPLLPIGAGADNTLCLLQSHLTEVHPRVKTFPIVDIVRLMRNWSTRTYQPTNQPTNQPTVQKVSPQPFRYCVCVSITTDANHALS